MADHLDENCRSTVLKSPTPYMVPSYKNFNVPYFFNLADYQNIIVYTLPPDYPTIDKVWVTLDEN